MRMLNVLCLLPKKKLRMDILRALFILQFSKDDLRMMTFLLNDDINDSGTCD